MKNISKIIAAMLSATLCCSGMTLLSSAHDLSTEQLLDKYADSIQCDYGISPEGDAYAFYSLYHKDVYPVYVDENGVVDENPDVASLLEQYQELYPDIPGALYYVTEDGAAWENPATGAWLYFGTLSNSFYYRVREDGTAKIIGCDYQAFSEADTTVLEIPSEIDGYIVTEIGQSAFSDLGYNIKTIERIIVPDSVRDIGENAFYSAGCDVNIPSQVVRIDGGAYAYLLDDFNGKMILPDTLECLDPTAFYFTLVTEYRFPDSKILNEGYLNLSNQGWMPYSEEQPPAFLRLENYISAVEVRDYFLAKDAAKSLPTIAPNGDVNQSGTTEIGDAILLSRMVAEDASVTVSAEGIAAADVVTDGTLDGADITAILQIIANPNA